jgi:hypothetical protein
VLTYDTGMGVYVVDLDKEMLRGAPTFARDEVPHWAAGMGERASMTITASYPTLHSAAEDLEPASA